MLTIYVCRQTILMNYFLTKKINKNNLTNKIKKILCSNNKTNFSKSTFPQQMAKTTYSYK